MPKKCETYNTKSILEAKHLNSIYTVHASSRYIYDSTFVRHYRYIY